MTRGSPLRSRKQGNPLAPQAQKAARRRVRRTSLPPPRSYRRRPRPCPLPSRSSLALPPLRPIRRQNATEPLRRPPRRYPNRLANPFRHRRARLSRRPRACPHRPHCPRLPPRHHPHRRRPRHRPWSHHPPSLPHPYRPRCPRLPQRRRPHRRRPRRRPCDHYPPSLPHPYRPRCPRPRPRQRRPQHPPFPPLRYRPSR